MESMLATGLTNKANVGLRTDISTAVLKNILDQQEAQAQAIVEMIKSSSLDGTGKIVDRYA